MKVAFTGFQPQITHQGSVIPASVNLLDIHSMLEKIEKGEVRERNAARIKGRSNSHVVVLAVAHDRDSELSGSEKNVEDLTVVELHSSVGHVDLQGREG